MLFDRSLASFINNIIYIDRPNNYKIWLEVVCTIFCFLKMTSFHTPHNNFKTLLLPSKLQREKWQEKLPQILDPLLFSDVFSFFFSYAILERETDTGAYRRFLTSNLNLQNIRNKMPLCWCEIILDPILMYPSAMSLKPPTSVFLKPIIKQRTWAMLSFTGAGAHYLW